MISKKLLFTMSSLSPPKRKEKAKVKKKKKPKRIKNEKDKKDKKKWLVKIKFFN